MNSNEERPPESVDRDHLDARLRELEKENRRLKAQLARQRALTEQRYAQLRNAELVWKDLQGNLTWKILEQLRALRLRLAPLGSSRDEWLDGWTEFALTARKQGIRSAWKMRRTAQPVEQVRQEIEAHQVEIAYQRWIQENDPLPDELDAQREIAAGMADGPRFLAVIFGTDAGALEMTLESFQAQTYLHWQTESLEGQRGLENLLAGLEKTEYVGFFQAGDQLSPQTLFLTMEALRAHPKTALIYSDEDILVDGVRQSPWFKPDFSPELLLSANYLSGAWFHSDLIQSAALSASDPDQLSWQLGLHAADSQVAHHLPTVLLHHPQANRAQPIHPAQVSDPSSARKVSIIIPTREQPETLRTCLDSIFSLSDYPDFEIILVDNASQEAETLAYYDELKANDKIRFVEYPETFNYQAANNRGVAAGQGEVLLFLNNDTEVLEPGWLEEMVRWVDRSGVGVVGAKLLFPDGTIQHAGVVLGLMGHAHHIFWGGPEDQTGPFGSPSWYRNYSAVTGACLMIERETFEQVGGFDEGLSLGFGDLDLCLKVRELGQRIVYTPFARLVHHEGRSRGAHVPISDMVATYDRVEALLEAGDPYFNPNLSTLNTLPIPRTAAEPRPAEHLRNTLFRIRGPRKRGYLDPNAMKRPFERRLFQAAAEQRPLELNQIKPATAGVLRPPHSQLSFLLSVTSGGQDRVLSFDPSARWLDPQPEIELASLPDQSPVKLPYTDRQFTHVYLGDGLARVPDWAGLLREALRVCQRSVQFHLPNGDLLTELGQAALLQGPLADPAHQYIYSADILDNLLETINDREGSPDLRWELQTFGRLQDNHPSPKGWIFGRIQKEHPQNLLD